jgi:hypothetical protein
MRKIFSLSLLLAILGGGTMLAEAQEVISSCVILNRLGLPAQIHH